MSVSSLLKNTVVEFLKLAQLAAKLRAALGISIRVILSASHPRDDAAC